MIPEVPYMLYLNFRKPAESLSLISTMEADGLICLGEERIDDEFSIVHFHLPGDAQRKAVLHVEMENNSTERINISIYLGTTVEVIKELFLYFTKFDPEKVALIDQQIKNALYLKDHDSFKSTAESTVIPEVWIARTEKAATLSTSFDDFYRNEQQVKERRFSSEEFRAHPEASFTIM